MSRSHSRTRTSYALFTAASVCVPFPILGARRQTGCVLPSEARPRREREWVLLFLLLLIS